MVIIVTLLIIIFIVIITVLLWSAKTVIAIYYIAVVFLLSSVIFLLLGLEYFSLLYLLIYLGAIMVLYVMVTSTTGSSPLDHFEQKFSTGIFFTICIFFCFFFFLLVFSVQIETSYFLIDCLWVDVPFVNVLTIMNLINLKSSSLASTVVFFLFEHFTANILLVGIILLIALMGAIILTISLEKKKK